ncbi:hypothetical protein [Pseudonocardia acidicola]|uniref:UDP-glucose/GDP-mannose dehydrogenase N-terminal domain-containing protein n=1 Tax=Pseudonocardia acidicola TaxID=2724939 RepID=A0ABX1S5R0_9PSEU|nr:hypothetical protein [Pseudonocardia acidicola]NMH95922.1 hypothetical protein [Pseudonocardia acidicola]
MTAAARPRVVVVGQGRAGAISARRSAMAGHDTVRFDPWGGRIEDLASADRERAAGRRSGDLRVATDPVCCAGLDVAVLAVPAAPRDAGPGHNTLEIAAAVIAEYLRPGTLVVLESTARPGTTEEVVLPTLEFLSGLRAGTDFALGYSPEPARGPESPRVVSGVDAASRARVEAFYGSLGFGCVAVTSPRVAELVSLLERDAREVDVTVVDRLAVLAGDAGLAVRSLVRPAPGVDTTAVHLVHPEDAVPDGPPARHALCWSTSRRRVAGGYR